MNLKLHQRISFRQALITVAVGLVLGLAASGAQVGYDLWHQRRQAEADVTRVVNMFTGLAARAVYTFNQAQAERTIAGLLAFPAIRRAAIIDDFGKVLAEGERPLKVIRPDWLADLVFGPEAEISFSLELEGQAPQLGRLAVILDRHQIVSAFMGRAQLALLGELARNLLLACLLALLFYYYLTHPLLRLVARLAAVDPARPGAGELPTPRIHRQDEVGLLARTINQLLTAFQASLERSRAAERASQASEERLRLLVESSHDAIITLDQHRRIEGCNPAFLRLFGLDRQEVLGESVLVIHPDADSFRRTEQIIYAAVISQGSWRGEWRYRRKTGELIQVEEVVSPRRADNGTLIGYVSVMRDITERLQAERERDRLEAQLQQARKMEAVGTLASGIAHDFNNLLQAISGYVQLIQGNPTLDQTARNQLAQVDEAAERATDLVRRLLTFSRKVKPRLGPMDLNQEVVRAVKMLERTIPKMIRIESALAPDLWPVKGDPSQLLQALLNLGSNAKDAMPGGGTLRITTSNQVLDEEHCLRHMEASPGRHVCLEVRDNGVGMDQRTIQHIFEPFFTTKRVGEGTGLGLSTVYGIVRAHGGHLLCQSQPGQGTTFTIYLPALTQRDDGLDPAGPRGTAPRGQETILLVEDEEAVRNIARETLEGFGYRTIGVASGEEALAVYAERGPEIALVVLDLGMPGMGGHRCLVELKKLDPEVRVIVASGYLAEQQVKKSLELGARSFIGKPYRLKQLLSEVRRVLDA